MTDYIPRGHPVTITAGPLKGWSGYVQQSHTSHPLIGNGDPDAYQILVMRYSTDTLVGADSEYGKSTTRDWLTAEVWVAAECVQRTETT